jgi:hypothetical protein
MGLLLRTKRHAATGKQIQVLVAAVNRHMTATPSRGCRLEPHKIDLSGVPDASSEPVRSRRGPAALLYRRRARGAADGQMTDSTGKNRTLSRNIPIKPLKKQ